MPAKKSKNSRPKVSNRKSPSTGVESYTNFSPRINVLLHFAVATVVGMIVCIVIGMSGLLILANSYLQTFSSTANVDAREFIQTVQQGLSTEPSQTNNRKNMLLLGTDALDNREGEKILTDTIMVMSLDLESGQLYALSFPRDLWIEKHSRKINGLYQIGREQDLPKPEQLTESTIEEMIEMEIHHTIVMSLESVAEIIDSLGGVEIDIPETFVDHRYPRAGVDIQHETDPDVLYETVEFVQGKETMSGERALKYIRSRKSLNPNQGTDDARVKRQQQVIAALLFKLRDTSIVKQPKKLGELYKVYGEHFESQISTTELVATALKLRSNIQHLEFSPSSLSIEQNGKPGVIYHPTEDRVRGWVYEIKNAAEFKQEVSEKLGMN